MESSCSNTEGATARTQLSLMINNFGEEGTGDLTPDTREKARRELNETDEKRVLAIAELKEMIANDPKTAKLVDRTDDSFYLRYLRARKFDVARAFRIVQNHSMYPERIGYPHLYYRTLTPGQAMALEQGVLGVLAKRDKLGRKVSLSSIE